MILFQAHGAEILCSRCDPATAEAQDIYTISKQDTRWQRYLYALRGKGYFRVSDKIHVQVV